MTRPKSPKNVFLPNLKFAKVFPAPESPVEDPILIIHSVMTTPQETLHAAMKAIDTYRRKDIRGDRPADVQRFICTRATKFQVPKGAARGASLGTELLPHLQASVGAIAFVDDLRPNIAYEVGYFHGKGVPVLLLTPRDADNAVGLFSDLLGCPVSKFTDHDDLRKHIHGYLDDLFEHLENVRCWPTYDLPSPFRNLLARNPHVICRGRGAKDEAGEFGLSLKIFRWDEPVDVLLKGRLAPEARFKVALRSAEHAQYAVYFQVSFRDIQRKPRKLWLALSSWSGVADFRSDERNIPADGLQDDWRYITGTFAGLLRQGQVSEVQSLRLERVRFRTGAPHSELDSQLEVGYLDVEGLIE